MQQVYRFQYLTAQASKTKENLLVALVTPPRLRASLSIASILPFDIP